MWKATFSPKGGWIFRNQGSGATEFWELLTIFSSSSSEHVDSPFSVLCSSQEVSILPLISLDLLLNFCCPRVFIKING